MHTAARPHGIMFHHFHNETHPVSQGSISADQLAQIIEHHGADRFLCAQDWFQKATTGTLCADDVCITFDDALLCQYDVALPVLEHYGLTGFWFAYTSVHTGSIEMLEVYRSFRHQCFTDIDHFYKCFFDELRSTDYQKDISAHLEKFEPADYLSDCPFYSDEDKEFRFVRDVILDSTAYNDVMTRMMKDQGFDIGACVPTLWMQEDHLRHLYSGGHVVGLHSHTHPTALASLPVQDQEKEYVANHEALQRILGEAPLTVAHPCNSYSQDTLIILRRLGIKLGFRGTMAIQVAASELEFPREDHANIIKGL